MTTVILLLFGPVTFVAVALIGQLPSSSLSLHTKLWQIWTRTQVDLSSISGVCSLCWSICGLGWVLLYVSLCEATTPTSNLRWLSSDDKHYDRDQFLFLILAAIGGTVCMTPWKSLQQTTETSTDIGSPTDVAPFLNRHQTDEWKGWMQIILLLYNYCGGCEEEYQPFVQTLIACYVWMTGYGHVAYASSPVHKQQQQQQQRRVVYVLWRLCFLAALLHLAFGTPVLYYGAVLLHVGCFGLVYTVMHLMSYYDVHSAKWSLRIKVLLLSIVLLFVFSWDSAGPLNARALESLSADHWYYHQAHLYLVWPSLLGMTFGLNMPVMSLYFQKLEDGLFVSVVGKGIFGSILFLACCALGRHLLLSDSLDDNSFSYFFVAFVLAYAFLRNITETVRDHFNPVLRFIGKHTLELHLLHHHIWLTSGSSRVLVLVAGYPKLNFLLCSLVFILASRQARQATRLLGDALWSPASNTCPRSAATTMLLFCLASVGVAHAASALGLPQFVVGCLWSVVLGYLATQKILRHYAAVETRPGKLTMVSGLFSVITLYFLVSMVLPRQLGSRRRQIAANLPLPVECEASVLNGDWINVNTCDEKILGLSRRQSDVVSFGTCDSLAWAWNNEDSLENCRFSFRHPEGLLHHLDGRNITFVGDSIVRHLYHASCRLLGDSSAGAYNTSAEKHSDYSKVYGTSHMEFRWAPYVANISGVLQNVIHHTTSQRKGPDLLVIGGGAWDRLHMFRTGDEQAILFNSVTALKDQMREAAQSAAPIVWVSPTAMNSWALNTEAKRQNIREDQMVQFRDLFGTIGIYDAATFVLHGTSFTSRRVDESYDGVHYPFPIYDGGAQILANAYDWLLEAPPVNFLQKPDEGERSSLLLPFVMLIVLATALFLLDSFCGLSYVVAWLKPTIQPHRLYEEFSWTSSTT